MRKRNLAGALLLCACAFVSPVLAQTPAEALCKAVQDAQTTPEALKQMLKNGLTPATPCDRRTAFTLTALSGRVDLMKVMLERHADINSHDADGKTALIVAAANDKIELMQWLLDHKADISARDAEGQSALHRAAHWNHVEATRFLLQHGAAVDARDNDGSTPLLEAAANHAAKAMKVLLEGGAKADAHTAHGVTALSLALYSNSEECLRLLDDQPFDVRAVDKSKWTLLHNAARGGNLDWVRRLLNRGADLEARTSNGLTPLFLVTKPETAQVLLDFGAQVDAENDTGSTPLEGTMWRGETKIALLLLERGANLNHLSRDGYTPFGCACSQGNTEAMEAMLRRGANTEQRDAYGNPPLLQTSSPDAIRLLARHGANLEATDANGFTILQVAALYRSPEVVAALLEAGANVNAVGAHGETAAYTAASMGKTKNLRLLAESGADLEAKTPNGASLVSQNFMDTETREIIEAWKYRQALYGEIAALAPQEQFSRCVEALRTHPRDNALRRKVLQLAISLPQRPAVPEEARQLFKTASERIQQADAPGALREPITLLQRVTAMAPWWGNAYYNLAKALELSSSYDEAIEALQYYIQLAPNEADATAGRADMEKLKQKAKDAKK